MSARVVIAEDGTRLSVRDNGRANCPAVLLADGIGCDGYIWKYVRAAFDDSLRVVHVHHRGHGSSESPADLSTLTVAQLARDLWTVCDALEIERVALWGHSMGVQVTLEAAALAPQRVTALLPTCGAFETPLSTFRGSDVGARVLPWVQRAVTGRSSRFRKFWRQLVPTEAAYWVAVATEINPRLIRRGDFLPYLDHLADMDPEVFVTLLGSVAKHSTRAYLDVLTMPALVFAGSADNFTPAHLSRELADLLPHAELCVVPGGSHTAPLEVPELIELRARRFLEANGILAGGASSAK
jgi:pimeloyl-ACP methyl ester carboxylesterase